MRFFITIAVIFAILAICQVNADDEAKARVTRQLAYGRPGLGGIGLSGGRPIAIGGLGLAAGRPIGRPIGSLGRPGTIGLGRPGSLHG